MYLPHRVDVPRPGVLCVAFVTGCLLLLLGAVGSAHAGSSSPATCSDEAVTDVDELLRQVTTSAPTTHAARARQNAALAGLRAEQLRRRPTLALLVEGDAGQRGRPSEESASGPGGVRGLAMAEVRAPLIESGRDARRDALLARIAVEDATAAERRGALLPWVAAEGATAAERRGALQLRTLLLLGRLAGNAALALPIDEFRESVQRDLEQSERRVQAGLDPPGGEHSALDELRGLDRLRSELESEAAALREELALMAMLCSPDQLPPLPALSDLPPAPSDSAPSLAAPGLTLRAEAEVMRADAELMALQQALLLEGVARTGAHLSSAFDAGYREEYVAGLSMRWSPDLVGLRRSEADRLGALAAALDAEAWAMDGELEAEIVRLQGLIDGHDVLEARLAADTERLHELAGFTDRRFRSGVASAAESHAAARALRAHLLVHAQIRRDAAEFRLERALLLTLRATDRPSPLRASPTSPSETPP